jgi:hypothetical protein
MTTKTPTRKDVLEEAKRQGSDVKRANTTVNGCAAYKIQGGLGCLRWTP